MASILQKIFGDANKREVRRLWKIVEQVNAFEPEVSTLKAEQFALRTAMLKERLAGGATLDQLLPEAFALAREAARRTTGMRPFDVQILGGIVLHQGRISEMKTGEGKTLVATLPAYLNALTGRGVHIVTVNDYLAERDSEWMGPIYRILGLKVGLIVPGLSGDERRRAYAADVVYGTNNEFGFDYLRDNMVLYHDHVVQREPYYAIVDEVDSILIDEARTPLIISSQASTRHEFGRWKSAVERLIKKQARLIGDLLTAARENLSSEESDLAAEQLFLVRRGAPKHKKLLKIIKEPGVERLVECTRHRLMAEKRDKHLEEALFFSIDEITRAVSISQQGYGELVRENPEVARLLGYSDRAEGGDDTEPGLVEEGGDESAGEHLHYIHQLLKAYSLYERDVDYVVQAGKVIIVDEFTGRLMWGRRYSEGIHQAIEAKEGVEVQADTRTVASITFQNYFRMYAKLAGMTGTAATEEEEFRKIYGMDVVRVPTNAPMIRDNQPDLVYKTERAKFQAVVEAIRECHAAGQPVLVGTITVEKSDMLSLMLKRQGIPHEVLNAVKHKEEARVIAQAGRKGAVTISTNMAGRGTDIILGGNPEILARKQLQREYPLHGDDEPEATWLEERRRREEELIIGARKASDREREEVLAAGGLHVLGTERHESRRIDNQLRGRAGRQGDPGSSRFFISLEDDLMRLFGGDNIVSIMDRLGMEEEIPIDHPLIGGAIERAQKRVESRNFEIRRHLLEYDDVLNEQRRVIYEQRRRVLEGEEMRKPVLDMVEEVLERRIQLHLAEKGFLDEESATALVRTGEGAFLRRGQINPAELVELEPGEAQEALLAEARAYYDVREEELGPVIMRELERVVLLRTVDSHWMDHIDAMHDLRQNIHLRAYGQRDPLVEYRHEGFEMFEAMICSIQEEVTRVIYQLQVLAQPQRRAVVGITAASHQAVAPVGGGRAQRAPAAAATSPPGRAEPEEHKQVPVTVTKVGRNEPCPCGSGKKYKRCCGR